MELKIGGWVVGFMDGAFIRDDAERIECFATKQEALAKAWAWSNDCRLKPKVERVCAGEYNYYPKDWDTGRFGRIIEITRLTSENIAEYRDISNYAGEYARGCSEEWW